MNHIRGGQRSYTARANVANWIEERFDKKYRSTNAVMFERRQYDSMSTSTLREAQKVYLKKQQRKMTCKLPEVGGKDFRSRTWERTNLINYATPDPKSLLDAAGRYWVGTAPSNMYKSVNATSYGEKQKAGFQIRSLGSDGRSRMLSSMKPEHKPDPDVLAEYKARARPSLSTLTPRSFTHCHVLS